MEEIQDSHFSRKRGYFGTHLREFGEKGVNFDVQCFTVKKGGSFGMKSQCFITKTRSCFAAKRGSFSNWRTRMDTTFSSEGAGIRVPFVTLIITQTDFL